MFVVVTYIVQHLLSPLLLKRRQIFILGLVNVGALILIYAIKNDTYDLVTYTQAMDWPWVHEIGYATLAIILKAIFHVNRTALYAVQALLVVVFCIPMLIVTKKQKDRLVYFLIVFLSVGFTLGVNNAIRQAFSANLILISLLLIFKRRYFWALVVFALSMLFHTSGAAFFAFSVVTYIVAKTLYYPSENPFRTRLNSSTLVALLLVIGVVTYYAISMILALGFYKDYGAQGMAADSSRTGALIKVLIVFCVYVASEALFGPYERKESTFMNFRLFRTAFLVLVISLAFKATYYELDARVLYFYFILEMMLMVAAFQAGKRNGVALIIASYAFALNAINILGGSA